MGCISGVPKVVQREGGARDRAKCQREQRSLVIVPCDPIGAKYAAVGASVDQGPLAILTDLDCDRCHGAAAGAAAVPGLFVQMLGPQAAWAVIAVPGSE